MGNSDRYCIRLDFPHEGEDNIHLNINEPAHKHSSGFPFGEDGYIEAFNICQDEAVFNELFYFLNDLYWFRSNYATVIKHIGKNNKEQGQALEGFLQKMRHLVLLSPDKCNLASVSVPKNKPCKRNNHQNLTNTKRAAKESNAEERLHAGCKIYGEEQRSQFAAFHTSPVSSSG